jgi:hypothetical protein
MTNTKHNLIELFRLEKTRGDKRRGNSRKRRRRT